MRETNWKSALGCLALCVALGCRPSINKPANSAPDYHKLIRTKEIRPSLLSAPVHGSSGEYNSLVIGETEFKDVRGFPPYYLDVPEQQQIVFVTGRWGEVCVIHVHDFRVSQHFEFKPPPGSRASSFGGQIGGKDPLILNVVEHASTNELVLAETAWDMLTKITISLDLVNQKIAKVEFFYFDNNRAITNSFVESLARPPAR